MTNFHYILVGVLCGACVYFYTQRDSHAPAVPTDVDSKTSSNLKSKSKSKPFVVQVKLRPTILILPAALDDPCTTDIIIWADSC